MLIHALRGPPRRASGGSKFFGMACLFPFYVDDVPVPCGRCPACLVRRTDSWVFRILQEERTASSVLWIRLSYDNAHLPISPNGHATLSVRDVQLFMKRLRRRHPVGHPKITYYLCGEYGSLFKRPHYHVILLNALEEHLFDSWVSVDDVTGEISSNGEIYIDPRPLTSGAIGYTCGYMNKKRIIPAWSGDDRKKEFSLMSKKLGLSYLSPAIVAYHKADVSRNFVTLPGGKRCALPRYYADRVYTDADRLARLPALEAGVRAKSLAVYDDFFRKFPHASKDDFILSMSERRRSAVRNFQSHNSNRVDS